METLVDKIQLDTLKQVKQKKPLLTILRKIKTKLSIHQLSDISKDSINKHELEDGVIYDSGLGYVPQSFMKAQRNTTMPFLKNGRISQHICDILEKDQIINKNKQNFVERKSVQKIPKLNLKTIQNNIKEEESKSKKKQKVLMIHSENKSCKKIPSLVQPKQAKNLSTPFSGHIQQIPLKVKRNVQQIPIKIKRKLLLQKIESKKQTNSLNCITNQSITVHSSNNETSSYKPLKQYFEKAWKQRVKKNNDERIQNQISRRCEQQELPDHERLSCWEYEKEEEKVLENLILFNDRQNGN